MATALRPAEPLSNSIWARVAELGRPLENPFVRVVARRLVLAIPLLFVVSVLTFLLIALVPGDPAVIILGLNQPKAAYQHLDKALGLNQPLYDQYWHWLVNAIHGNLGTSIVSNEPVTQMMTARVGTTISLTLVSLFVMSLIGVPLGMFSAIRGGAAGRFVDSASLVGFAIPGFWLGAVLIGIFAVGLHWFPAVGYVPITQSPVQWIRSLALPVVALGAGGLAILIRQTREVMLDTLASEHIRMARASGVPRRQIYFRLAFKVTGVRIVTIVGLQMIGLVLGTVFVEQVFALPGLGSLLVASTERGDFPVVQGVTVFFTVIVLAINLIVDLAYSVLDPRVRTS
jgi:peptide/nickel transport system permease protein